MKQKALQSFAGNALKGSCMSIFIPLCVLFLIYVSSAALSAAAASVLLYAGLSQLNILLFCAVRSILKITAVLASVKSRCAVIRHSVISLSLSCGYERRIYKRLVRLYLLRWSVRTLCRFAAAAVLITAVWLLADESLHIASLYRIMLSFQAVPLTVLILIIRLRLELSFAGAEVLSVRYPDRSSWKNFRDSLEMLHGQHLFIAGIILRNTGRLLMPFLLPKFAGTLVSYFSVRYIEYCYMERSDNERAYI